MIKQLAFVSALLISIGAAAQTQPTQPKIETKQVTLPLMCGDFPVIYQVLMERGYQTLLVGDMGQNTKIGVMVDNKAGRFLFVQSTKVDETTIRACVMPGGTDMKVDPENFSQILSKYVGTGA